VGELELIGHIRSLAARRRLPWLEVGIGDDAAALRLPGGQRLAVTCDMTVEGVHFEPGTRAEAVAWKAVARCLSDLAAMAARPLCLLAGVNFGAGAGDQYARRLVDALWEACVRLGAPLVGGDIASGAGARSRGGT